jgi:hypothetical protein
MAKGLCLGLKRAEYVLKRKNKLSWKAYNVSPLMLVFPLHAAPVAQQYDTAKPIIMLTSLVASQANNFHDT